MQDSWIQQIGGRQEALPHNYSWILDVSSCFVPFEVVWFAIDQHQ